MKEFEYRMLFVKFKRDQYGLVNVTNDGWHKGSFFSEVTTQEAFNKECEDFMATDHFKEAMKIYHG